MMIMETAEDSSLPFSMSLHSSLVCNLSLLKKEKEKNENENENENKNKNKKE